MFRVVNSACPPILPFLVPVTLPQRVCLHSHTAQDEGKTYVEEEPKVGQKPSPNVFLLRIRAPFVLLEY
jgi:hypothetical protein